MKSSSPHRSKADRIACALGLQELFYRECLIQDKEPSEVIISPCRSKVAAVARIESDGRIPEKKSFGRRNYFFLNDLVRKEEAAKEFFGGQYINLYLSPWDYHFLIFPSSGKVVSSFYQDGINLPVVAWGGAIFKNSKLVTVIESPLGFRYGLVMIASWMVAGLDPRFQLETPYARGDVFGRFRIGSTVVLLFPPNSVEVLCRVGQKIELGSPIARWKGLGN